MNARSVWVGALWRPHHRSVCCDGWRIVCRLKLETCWSKFVQVTWIVSCLFLDIVFFHNDPTNGCVQLTVVGKYSVEFFQRIPGDGNARSAVKIVAKDFFHFSFVQFNILSLCCKIGQIYSYFVKCEAPLSVILCRNVVRVVPYVTLTCN